MVIAAASVDQQHELSAHVAVLADAVRLRDVGEREGLGDREREASGLDQAADLGECVERPAGVPAAERHPVLLRAGEVGDRHDVLWAADELAGELDPQDAAWAADIFATLVNHAAIEADARHADRQEQAGELYKNFTGLPPDRFPLITAHAAQLVAGDAEERFRVAVDVVTDGMLARSARP
jgi:hypothetical protein